MSVPIDRPITQILQYSANNPPAVPQLYTIPDMYNWIPFIASEIANGAGMLANKSDIRMLCYNVLAENGWRNNDYADVVKLAADLAYLSFYEHRQQDIGVACREAATEALTMYCSKLMYEFDGLLQRLPPDKQHACQDNMYSLQEKLQRIYEMYYRCGIDYRDGIRMESTRSQFSAPPTSGFPAATRFDPGYERRSAAPPASTGRMMPPLMSGGFDQTVNAGRASSQRIGSQFGPGTAMGSTAREVISQDKFFNRGDNIMHTEQPVTIETTAQPVGAVYVTTLGGSEMERDRNKINYFGEVYITSPVVHEEENNQAIDKMVNTTATDEHSEVVQRAVIMEPTLESAILAGKIEHLRHLHSHEADLAYRCFAMVLNPVLSIYNGTDYVAAIREAKSLIGVARKIKDLTAALDNSENKASGEVKARLSVLNHMDNILTDIMRRFLTYRFDASQQIDSFVEDLEVMWNAIERKKTGEYLKALTIFDRQMMDSITTELPESVLRDIRASFDMPDELHMTAVPINISLTYLEIDSKELGLNVTDKPLLIEQNITPRLYEIAASIKKHNTQRQSFTLRDFLLLSDNVRYEIYEHVINKGQFFIARA